ncbi:MAG: hypothetical protein ACI8P0_005524 [Planctomycetaceae bacterium]|jgi:hypothetical protein
MSLHDDRIVIGMTLSCGAVWSIPHQRYRWPELCRSRIEEQSK